MIQNNDCKIVLVQKVYDPTADNNFIPHYDVKVVGRDDIFENVSEEHLHPFGSTDPSFISNALDPVELGKLPPISSCRACPSSPELDQSFSMDPLKKELLEEHIRLGHAPFETLIRMADKGLISQRLRHVKEFPLCASCLYGKHHRRPWRGKGKSKSSI